MSGRSLKSSVDLLIAAVLLVLLAPVILVVMALIRLTSAGSPLYIQKRAGKGGRVFKIYKLRTMYHDCERASGIRWATANDPRVTPLGRILRKTHLDELPQLWNVLRGDMSLVGPRPERPEIIAQLERKLPEYREREQMLPGVTGLAQVQLPPDSDLDGVRRKLAHDLYYLQNASLWLDARIVLCTALKVFCIPSRLTCVVLGIPCVDADGAEASGLAPARGARAGIQPA
ncbi:MAG: sugar transferase [Isosphaeraceae bacterium]